MTENIAAGGRETTLHATPRGNYHIYMIWVRHPSDPSGTAWLVDAWDEGSIDENRGGWTDAQEDAIKKYGGANVRISRTLVDYDAVLKSFEPADV
jgi:hypothetical protein